MIQYWFMEEVWGKESSFLKGMGNQKMMQTIRDGRTILMKIMKLQVLSILRTIQSSMVMLKDLSRKTEGNLKSDPVQVPDRSAVKFRTGLNDAVK